MPTAAVARNAIPDLCRSSAGLRQRLRAATAEDHARLDRQLGALDLQSLGDYREFLELSGAALLPLEAALVAADIGVLFPDWPARSRRATILSDLAAAGGSVRPLSPPAPLDFGGVLGTMYVLEGSRLGARYLLKTVAQSPNRIVRNATSYLAHGAGQHLWPSFLVRLEGFERAPHDEARAIDAARAAFGLFEQAIRASARADA